MQRTFHSLFRFVILVVCGVSTANAQYIVAHRGASYDAPENTLAAFELAWQRDADGIEGDFYVTEDQQIVCIHDSSTKRTAPDQTIHKVAESTLAELRHLDVGSWKDAKFAGERIPTLAEVLATVPPGKKIFIEVKCGPHILPLMKPQIKASGLKPEQIVIICFQQEVIAKSRQLMPEYKANWLTGFKQDSKSGTWKPTPETILATLKRTGATGLGGKGTLEPFNQDLVDAIHDGDWEAHVWTVNKVSDARYFSDIGVESITTDRPAVIGQGIGSGGER